LPPLEFLAHLCTSAASQGATLPAILFTAGLTGSVVHCATMCGPLVLGQVGDRLARMPAARLCETNRLGAAALLPYHLGRITTYSVLGAIAALLGGAVAELPWLGWLRAGLLLVGAMYFLIAALTRFGILKGARGGPGANRLGRFVRQLAGRARALGGFPLGLALGLIPCGLVYAALAVAAATGRPLMGALAMAVFGLGTVPSLIAVGLAGYAAGNRMKSATAAITPFVLVANAALLGSLALATLAS
jgi:sulfite exporter TauE/SafE